MDTKMNRLLSVLILFRIYYLVYGDEFDPSIINGLAGADFSNGMESHNSISKNVVTPLKYCRKPANCEKLTNTLCYGIQLPYVSTSLDYAPDVKNQNDAQKKLLRWKELMYIIPRCWSVIQPFLCAIYMPKCENDSVKLPSKEMCEVIQSKCSILQTGDLWPYELRCNASYESTCVNDDVQNLKFHTTNDCRVYDGVERCWVKCQDPFHSVEEQENLRSFIESGFFPMCWLNGLAMVMAVCFLYRFGHFFRFRSLVCGSRKCLSWHTYFWKNFCFFLVSLGFYSQFWSSNDRIICHADGTLKTSEPISMEDLSCVANFIVVYFFLVAGIMWVIMSTHTWMIRSEHSTRDEFRKRCDKLVVYYHAISWSVPLVLTVIIVALQQVDGDGLSGICFVGVINKDMKLIFFLGPFLFLIIACSFLGICIFRYSLIRRTKRKVMSQRTKKTIDGQLLRLKLLLIIILLLISITIYCQYYEWNYYHSWKKKFLSYIGLKLPDVKDIAVDDRDMQIRPNYLVALLQYLVIFAFCLIFAILHLPHWF